MAIYPFVYVGDDAVIGDGTTLYPGAVIGERLPAGTDVIIHPNAVLYPTWSWATASRSTPGRVLGGDGFGYRLIDGRHVKIPHTGRVEDRQRRRDRGELHDRPGDVRGDPDRRGHQDRQPRDDRPQQPDRPPQPALRPGRHRRQLQDRRLRGHGRPGGIKDNTEIGDQVMVGAQAGVHRNVPAGQNVLGSPAVPVREQRRIFQMIARLPEMHRQLRELTAQLAMLSAAVPSPRGSRNAESEIEPVRDQERLSERRPIGLANRVSPDRGRAGPLDLVQEERLVVSGSA